MYITKIAIIGKVFFEKSVLERIIDKKEKKSFENIFTMVAGKYTIQLKTSKNGATFSAVPL